jgi:hypothetical protein
MSASISAIEYMLGTFALYCLSNFSITVSCSNGSFELFVTDCRL